jgi:hypothetical protein
MKRLVAVRMLSFLSLSLLLSFPALADRETKVRLHVVENSGDVKSEPSRRAKKFDLEDADDVKQLRVELQKLSQLAELQKDTRKKSKVWMRFPYGIKSGGRMAIARSYELLEVVEKGGPAADAAIDEIVLMLR